MLQCDCMHTIRRRLWGVSGMTAMQCAAGLGLRISSGRALGRPSEQALRELRLCLEGCQVAAQPDVGVHQLCSAGQQ